MKIRPIKVDDLVEQYGFGFPYSVRGIAAEHEGRVVGVAGIMYCKPPQCFSKLDDEIRKFPRAIVEGMRKLRELLNEQSVPIYATPDEEESTANTFLEHVGFTETICEGVWIWRKQSPI